MSPYDLRQLKRTVRSYLAEHYDDTHLAALLAHAQDGRLAYHSCCCLIGIPTANHALRGFEQVHRERFWDHYYIAAKWPGARSAEVAYANLGDDDAQRRRRLIPLVRSEMKRRARVTVMASETMACYV